MIYGPLPPPPSTPPNMSLYLLLSDSVLGIVLFKSAGVLHSRVYEVSMEVRVNFLKYRHRSGDIQRHYVLHRVQNIHELRVKRKKKYLWNITGTTNKAIVTC